MAKLTETEQTIWTLRSHIMLLHDLLTKSRPWVQAMCDWAWEQGMVLEHDTAHALLDKIDAALPEQNQDGERP